MLSTECSGAPRCGAVVCLIILLCGCSSTGNWLRPGIGPASDSEPKYLDAKQTAEVELAMARTAEQQGDWATAMRIYRQVLENEPKHPVATHRVAVVHDRQGDFGESEKWFSKALKYSPDDPRILCDFGFSMYVQGRYQEAEVKLRKAVAIAPELDRAHNHLGLVLAQLGDNEGAFNAFRMANCTPAQAYTNLAVILATKGQTDDARQHLEFAKTVHPVDHAMQERLTNLESVVAHQASAQPHLPATQATFAFDSRHHENDQILR